MQPKKGSPEVKTRQKNNEKKNMLKTLGFLHFFLGAPIKARQKKTKKKLAPFSAQNAVFFAFFPRGSLGAPTLGLRAWPTRKNLSKKLHLAMATLRVEP